MTEYAVLMTLLVGIFIGITGTVAIAIKMEARAEKARRQEIHPSTRTDEVVFDILAYEE